MDFNKAVSNNYKKFKIYIYIYIIDFIKKIDSK